MSARGDPATACVPMRAAGTICETGTRNGIQNADEDRFRRSCRLTENWGPGCKPWSRSGGATTSESAGEPAAAGLVSGHDEPQRAGRAGGIGVEPREARLPSLSGRGVLFCWVGPRSKR